MNNSTLRVYPQSIEAERALLCSLFLDNSQIGEILEIISEDDFFDEKNAVIFGILKELYADGIPIDFITVSNAIKEKGLEQKIPQDYILSLTEFLPAPANTKYYAEIIRKKAIFRKLIFMSNEIATVCYEEPEDIEEVLNMAEKRLFEIVSSKSIRYKSAGELSDEITEYLEALKNRKTIITGVPSGFKDLDNMTNGFQDGDLIVIAGRPGMGKTSLAINIALNAALDYEKKVAIFTLEVSAIQVVLKMIASLSKVDMKKLRTGFFDNSEWNSVVKAIDKLKYAPIFIDETSLLTSIDIRTKARKLKMEKDIDLLIIDYLQLIEGRNSSVNRVQQISEISRALKILAKELSIPIIALSQLNRAVENREDKRPTPADLRESGSIEQDADIIMLLYRDEVYNKNTSDHGVAEINIAKQRNGPQGVVRVQFENRIASFRNLTPRQDVSNNYTQEEELDITERKENPF